MPDGAIFVTESANVLFANEQEQTKNLNLPRLEREIYAWCKYYW